MAHLAMVAPPYEWNVQIGAVRPPVFLPPWFGASFGVIMLDSIRSLDIIFHRKQFKAYSMLGIIKRNFIYMDETTFIQLYKSMVRTLSGLVPKTGRHNKDRKNAIKEQLN